MAFFGTPTSFLGLDIGTSSLKIVELLDRRRRVEVATYAQANIPNLLIHPEGPSDAAVRKVANIIAHMIDKAGVSSDTVVAALPSTIVFSTMLTMPNLPDQEMDKAVRFAARDVVPSDLDDMVLGWSKVAGHPHMETDAVSVNGHYQASAVTPKSTSTSDQVPVFLTAAPKTVVDRYIKVMDVLHLKVHALEVETFPLVRSLLQPGSDSALIIDIGDRATTFHIIDRGTPRVSHTIEYGGYDISAAIAKTLDIPHADGEKNKIGYGLHRDTPANIKQAIEAAVNVQVQKALSLLHVYKEKEGHLISRSILIGGGANLRELPTFWSRAISHNTVIGNPWKGLSYPQGLEKKLMELGPSYAVAVGLALRGLKPV